MGREFKDSGIEWIGRIPKEWNTERIKALFSERNERDCQGKTLLSVSQYFGIRPKSETDLADSHIAESYDDYKEVHKGDFVMNIMLAWNGSYAVSDYDGIVSPAYCVFKFRKDCCKKFFHYLLRTDGYPSAFKTMSRGVIDSRLRLYPEQFYTFPVVMPPLEEQKRIADYLDEKCGEIDSLIELQEQMIVQLTDYKQSIITEAVTKGLDPNATLVPSGIDWIGDVPKGWKVTNISKIAQTNSGSTPSNISNDNNSNIVWVRTTDIHDDEVFSSSNKLNEEEFKSASCPMLEPGTCLVAMYGGAGTIGKCGFLKVQATINQALCSIEVKGSCFNYYLFYVLRAFRRVWMRFAVGTRKDPNINQEIVKKMCIPLPPLPEQQSIATYLDSKCSKIDSLIAIKQQKIETLKDYKKSMIYECVTGKTDIV